MKNVIKKGVNNWTSLPFVWKRANSKTSVQMSFYSRFKCCYQEESSLNMFTQYNSSSICAAILKSKLKLKGMGICILIKTVII